MEHQLPKKVKGDFRGYEMGIGYTYYLKEGKQRKRPTVSVFRV